MKISKRLDEKLWEMAEEEGYGNFFCNVDEEDWPEDVDDYVENHPDNDGDEDGNVMDIWWPFEDDELSEVADRAYAMATRIHDMMVKAIELSQAT